MRPPLFRSTRLSTIEVLESRIAPATFLVTTNADSGAGSLRQAILDANASGGIDIVAFNLPAGLVISPLTQLPVINGSLIIDGYSQPGAFANTDARSSNAVMKVQLDGSLLPGGNGLVLGGSGGSVVRGLVITGFHPGINDSGNGISIKSSNNVVAGNFIGMDASGAIGASTKNSNAGVRVGDFNSDAVIFSNNIIGGTDVADRNVLGGNIFGVAVEVEAQGTQILGNLIGTDPTGTQARQNDIAGISNIGTGTLIGDGTSAGRNVISGNQGSGIGIGPGPGLEIRGNFIGTTANGLAAIPNQRGILAQNGAGGGLIEGNTISGNDQVGIALGSPFGDGDAHNFIVRGNLIGLRAGGGVPLPNNGPGIVLQSGAFGNTIGGEKQGDGNAIAFNDGPGIQSVDAGPNRFLGNGIVGNAGLGIDLPGDSNFFGVTPNDALDADGITNFPVISSLVNTGASVMLFGDYNGAPGRTYRLEFFAVAPNQIDLSGYGEGVAFLGSVEFTTDAAGSISFDFSRPLSLPADTAFTATATETGEGRTSEFGPAKGNPVTYTWNGTTSDWFTPGNWTPNGVPGPLDKAIYDGAGVPIILGGTASVATFLHNGGAFGGAGELNILKGWTWVGGSHDDPDSRIRIIEGAVGGLTAPTPVVWNSGTLEVRGTLIIQGGGLTFNSGELTIEPTGELQLHSGITDVDGVATVAFAENHGYIIKVGTGSFGLNGMLLNNDGRLASAEGTLTLRRMDIFGGSVELVGGNITTTDRINMFGGQLIGDGIVSGLVVNDGGVIRPGGDENIGILDFTGNVNILLGGTLSVEIDSGGNDLLRVGGTLTLGGTLEHRVIGGYVVHVNDSFEIVDGNFNGTFGTVVGRLPFTVTYAGGGPISLDAFGYVVTNTNDSGAGSLRQAIIDANTSNNPDFIAFNIPVPGMQTITPLTPLPNLSGKTFIDGYTQPGASANTLTIGNDAALLIQITGANGFNLAGSANGISGLLINITSGSGIQLLGTGQHTIQGNWIGINPAGTAQVTGKGIFINSSGNLIGGTAPAARNVIPGDATSGAIIGFGGSGNVIQGNYIGTRASGLQGLGAGGVSLPNNSTLGGAVPGAGNVISGSRDVAMISTNGSIVQGNIIGVDANGIGLLTNQGGFLFVDRAENNLIGGSTPAERNLIGFPVLISGVGGGGGSNTVSGNYIGVNANGNAPFNPPLQGGAAITLTNGAAGNVIGGSAPGEGNVIGNFGIGISVTSPNNVVFGNFIGTNAAGTSAIPNTVGISISGGSTIAGNVIGGSLPGQRNVISGNTTDGIQLGTSGIIGINTVKGNLIGVAADGTNSLGNGGSGIRAGFDRQVIGGINPGEGNTIAFNGLDGVRITGGIGTTIRGNSIFRNTALGINLEANGVTPNDPLDADTGPNGLLNFPVLASYNAGAIVGTYNGLPNTTFMLDFYGSPFADPSGNGEGENLVATISITTDGSGNAGFNVPIVFGNGFVTATATNSATGDTSEFSNAFSLVTPQVYVWDNDSGDGDWFNPINWDLNSGVPDALDTAILNTASSITLSAAASVASFQQSLGTFKGAGNLTVGSSFTWTGGAQVGAGMTTIAAGGTGTISGQPAKTLDQRTIQNDGTLSISGGPLQLQNGPRINNSGIVDYIDDDDIVSVDATSATFTNTGTLRKTGGTGKSSLGIGGTSLTINNSGIIAVTSGTLELAGAGGSWTGSPAISLSSGTTLEIGAGPVNWNAPSLSGAGRLLLSGGTLNVAGSLTIPAGMTLELAGGSIAGSGSLGVNGTLRWSWGNVGLSAGSSVNAGGTFNFGPDVGPKMLTADFTNSGAGTVNGSLTITNNAQFTNAGLLDFISNITWTGTLGTALINTGTMVKSGGVGDFVFGGFLAIANGGTVETKVGGFNFTAGYSQGGAGSLFLNGGRVGGTLALNGGELRGAGNISGNVNNSGATIRPGGTGAIGTLMIDGNYTQGAAGTYAFEAAGENGGQYDQIILTGSATLAGTLNIDLIGTYVPVVGDELRALQSVGNPTGSFTTLTGETTGFVQMVDSGIELDRIQTTFVWDAGGGADTSWFNPLNWNFDNGVPGPSDAAILNSASTIDVPSAVSIGFFTQNNGVVGGIGALTITDALTWGGGTQNGPGTTTIVNGATLTLNGGSKTLDRALFNNGFTNWVLGSVTGGSVFTNNNMFSAGAGEAFNAPFSNTVAATYAQTTGSNVFGGSFSNNGIVLVLGGNLALNGGFTQGAGSLQLVGGNVSTTGSLNFNGGDLVGVGTITGNVSNFSGTVRPNGAGSPGTLTINGNYSQGASGTLETEIAGTNAGQFDVLSVNGVATLAGTLTAPSIGAFTPPINSQFLVLTATSAVNGTFATAPATIGILYAGTGVTLLGPTPSVDSIVTTELDDVNPNDGVVSLREAIIFANTNPGRDVIIFNIPGAGLHSIRPSTGLPIITDPVIIDGYTQPGSSPNTGGPGQADNAVRLIEISGITIPSGFPDGLNITAGGSTVEGLILKRWRGSQLVLETGGGNVISGNLIGEDIDPSNLSANGHGIAIINSPNNIIGGTDPADRNRITGNVGSGVFITGASATGNTVLGNFIGTNAAGNGGFGNGNHGVTINGPNNNTVGGTSAQARNLISGNIDGIGVDIRTSSGNAVLGNFIGTDVTGSFAVRNLIGIRLFNAQNSQITDNVISGNQATGLALVFGAVGNQITGNRIGTDVTGMNPVGNLLHGVQISSDASNNTIGGFGLSDPNVISANFGTGISVLTDNTATGNVVLGNFIGTNAGGATLGNGGGGIAVGPDTRIDIGGPGASGGNTIAFNNGPGIRVDAASSGVLIRGNSIHSNSALGIDLNADGFTPNDAGDGDVGANDLQNFPLLSGVTSTAAGTTIIGTLDSVPDSTFRIEFFTADTADINGVGQGRTFLGFVVVGTNGAGVSTFSANFSDVLSNGTLVTATATSPTAGTSEFAVALAATRPETTVTTTLDVVDVADGVTSLREAILFTNSNAGSDTITFAIPGGGLRTIALTSPLPAITDPVEIDGYSQPGSFKNELAVGNDATILIMLDGSGAGTGADGLQLTVGSSTVRGLVIGGFNGAGIHITGPGNNVVAGNFIGTDSTGTAALGNSTGILIFNSSDNTIGGVARGDRNLISGNSSPSGALEAGAGIVLSGSGATSNTIINNYVGTNAAGAAKLANSKSGVAIYGGGSFNLIGDTNPAARNIISGNDGHGVDIAFSSSDNSVLGNYIGVSADGSAAIGNAGGGVLINFDSNRNIIGGTVAGAGNVIAANSGGGVALAVNVSANVVQGNRLGTTADGLTVLGNGQYSVVLGGAGPGNIIGGSSAGAGNLIAAGGKDGIRIENGSSFAIVQGNTIGIAADGSDFGDVRCAIRIFASNNTIGGLAPGEGNIISNRTFGVVVGSGTGNRILGNTFNPVMEIPIDLGDDEADDNDSGDVDGGPNLRQNYPIITGVNVIGTSVGIVGSLDTTPGTYTVQLYRSNGTSDFGHGLGTPFATFSITVDGGVQNFAEMIGNAGVSVDEFVSAIVVNDITGDTSEFSLAFAAVVASPVNVDRANPFTFTDASGDQIKVTLKGSGSLDLVLQGGVTDNADIAFISLQDTDLTSKLSITIVSPDPGGTSVPSITTLGQIQHVGSILLGRLVVLGDGVADSQPDILVSGKMSALILDDIAPNTIIQLGSGLPYNLPGNADPDSLNNRPTLTIGDVLGTGVQINVLNDGVPGPLGGVGGGGFGNVMINSWTFNGFIRTTQSIGNFFVRTGDFYGVLEVDRLHHGEGTQADVGAMTIADGAWGSSGTEIEGYVTAFNAEAFLAGASIIAGNIGTIKMTSVDGGFNGTLILTNPDAPSLPTFTVNSNFSGRVVSANSIKRLNIKGDFTGSLEAPSIGSITAFRFLGADDTDITATLGGIGLLKATSGVFRDYEIVTPSAFSGITVKLSKLTTSVVGVDNVHVTAASIGNITVSLAANKTSTGINLTGINNSDFITTSSDSSSKTSGKIGKVSVTLTGAAGGSGNGIADALFDARVTAGEFGANPASTVNSLGNITVKVTGFTGDSAGVDDARFEGDTIGSMKVTVTRGKAANATGFGARDVNLISTFTIGAMTFDGDVSATQVTGLSAVAGGGIGAVNVKSRTAAFGALVESTLLAGQALALVGTEKELKAALAGAALGPVTTSGAITGSVIAAGATLRGLAVGGELSDSSVLAGAMLGANRVLGGGDDTFQGAATIAAIAVKGAFARTSIAAGINPGNAVFGDADDVVAAAPGTLTTTGSIGAISLSLAGNPQPSSAVHNYAIEAATIKSLKTIAGLLKEFGTTLYLDTGATGEDSDDVLVRIL